MRKVIAALSALVFLVTPMIAFAAEWKDGYTPSNGVAPAGSSQGVWDGTHLNIWKGDSNGIGRVTEEYPITSQFASTAVASTQPVYWCMFSTTLQPFGTAWTAYPYGQKTLYLTKTVTGASTATSVALYVFGSEDGANFYPVQVPKGLTTTANQGNWLSQFSDTANIDTLKIILPKRGRAPSSGAGNTITTYSYTFPDWMYLGRYVQLYATTIDTVASSAVTLSARWGGREK